MDQQGIYIVLDPTQGSNKTEHDGIMAKRLNTLDGKVLSVINNGKTNSDVFLQKIIDLVKQKYNLKDVIWVAKTNASLPVTDSMIKKLKASQAVISGIGD